jgi:hypothetical protein
MTTTIITNHSNRNNEADTREFSSETFEIVINRMMETARSSRINRDDKRAEFKFEVRGSNGCWITRTVSVKGR